MKKLMKKQVLIPAGILGLLMLITVWALWDAENINPIEEDSKQAIKEENKADKEARKDIKEELGKEYPTMEEVQRYVKTMPESSNQTEYLEKEYNDEVIYLYGEGKLLSRSDSEDDAMLKTSYLKMRNDKHSVGSAMDLLGGGTFNLYPQYSTEKTGFEQKGDFWVGYEQAVIEKQEDTMSMVSKDGRITMTVTLYAYAKEELMAKEFQDKIGEFEVKVGGVKAKPFLTNVREDGKHNDELETKELKDVNLLFKASNWREQDFNKSVIYPGTVIPVTYEVDVQDTVYKDVKFDSGSDIFIGERDSFEITINGEPVELKLVQDSNEGMVVKR